MSRFLSAGYGYVPSSYSLFGTFGTIHFPAVTSPGNEMDSSSHTDHLLPGNLLKLPSNVQLIVGGLIALHVVFIVVALSCHFRSSRSAKPDFKSKLG